MTPAIAQETQLSYFQGMMHTYMYYPDFNSRSRISGNDGKLSNYGTGEKIKKIRQYYYLQKS